MRFEGSLRRDEARRGFIFECRRRSFFCLPVNSFFVSVAEEEMIRRRAPSASSFLLSWPLTMMMTLKGGNENARIRKKEFPFMICMYCFIGVKHASIHSNESKMKTLDELFSLQSHLLHAKSGRERAREEIKVAFGVRFFLLLHFHQDMQSSGKRRLGTKKANFPPSRFGES